jgi:branched-chain amino acid transport system permease protein
MKNKFLKIGIYISILVVAFLLPIIIKMPYLQSVMVAAAMYVAFALSFDICVGHGGMVSLAHPAFFGIGAYTAGILSTQFNTPFLLNGVIAALFALGLAILMAIPAFKLADISFAIGTLGLLLSTQLIATNWIKLTEGPMCLTGIPRPSVNLGPLGNHFLVGEQAFYYLFLFISLFIIVVYKLLTTGRIGRVFTALRNDNILAQFAGINILRYKRLAFFSSASLAGLIGGFWAHYMTVVCPDIMAPYHTQTLMIIVYIGGVGNFWGVVSGAILMTFIPEFLRITPSLRMVLFGVVLLVMVISLPQGLAGLFGTKFNKGGRLAMDEANVENAEEITSIDIIQEEEDSRDS